MPLESGARLGPYEIVSLIAGDGESEFFAVDPNSGRLLVMQYSQSAAPAAGAPIVADTFSGLTVALNWTSALKK